MNEILTQLKKFVSTSGISGYETEIRNEIENSWRGYVDEIQTSRLGSLHALIHGIGPEPRQTLLLTAHMDSIGFMVTAIIDGFLKLTAIGGIDPRVLPGQFVVVNGREKVAGMIVQPPTFLLPKQYQTGTIPLEYLLVDTGLSPTEVSRLIRVGDLVSYDQPPIELNNNILASAYLDNRASIASLTCCLHELKTRLIQWDIVAAATVMEEFNLSGATTSGFQIRPALAVIVDVTFGSSPGTPGYKTYPISRGVTLGWGPNIHPYLYKSFKELADRLEIPWKMEAMPRHSGTDAYGFQIAAEGIPTMVVSIPLRYMHTAVEMVSIQDIQRTGRLLAEFAASLDPNFVNKIIWEDQTS